jgi:hypothetical protein
MGWAVLGMSRAGLGFTGNWLGLAGSGMGWSGLARDELCLAGAEWIGLG